MAKRKNNKRVRSKRVRSKRVRTKKERKTSRPELKGGMLAKLGFGEGQYAQDNIESISFLAFGNILNGANCPLPKRNLKVGPLKHFIAILCNKSHETELRPENFNLLYGGVNILEDENVSLDTIAETIFAITLRQ